MPYMPKIKGKLKSKSSVSQSEDVVKEDLTKEEEGSKRKFVLVTADWSGLGFAIQETWTNQSTVIVAYKPKSEVEDDKLESYEIQGQGIVETMPLDELMDERKEYKDWYFVWDGNHNPEENETLRKEGFKVFGGGKLPYDLENDREFGIEFAEECGLFSSESQEFTSDVEAISFLEQNEDKAYVFKANGAEDSSLTQPFYYIEDAHEANEACRNFIKAVFPKMKDKSFILQERVKGVEVNVEIFYSNGDPVLAQANLEAKGKENDDLGVPVGCAFDVCWVLPLDSPLVQMTAGKLSGKFKDLNFTGFGDCNVIIGDNNVYFLEFCARFGYNAHPNFFSTVSKDTALQVAANLIEGDVVETLPGFGASISLHCDKEYMGYPIELPEQLKNNFHLFDGYLDEDIEQEDGDLILSMGGYGNEIGIVTAKNYTIERAFKDALDNAYKVKFPCRGFRTDAACRGYHSSPIERYEALKSMNLI